MVDSLIVVNGEEDIQILKDEIRSSKNSKIVSFDFVSHKSLKKLGISHEIVDSHFEKNDGLTIDELSVEFATSWYKQGDLSNQLGYSGLNIGYLLEGEILRYFLVHLRNMMGILRLIKKFQPKKIIAASLVYLLDSLSKEMGIILNKYETKAVFSLPFDQIEIPITLGKKTHSITVSRKRYLNTKKQLEKLVNLIFDVKPNIKNKDDKTILLLDFNPVFFSTLLKELPKTFPNTLLLNQRRPAIWNLTSINIIRKTNVKILGFDDLEKPDISIRIKNDQKKFLSKIDKTLLNDETLHGFFSLLDHSFWNSINKGFIEIVKQRSEEMIRGFVLIEKLFEKVNVDCILEWAHTGFEEKIVGFIAEKKNIPIYFMQHANIVQSSKYDKYLKIHPIVPSNNAKEIVWGDLSKKYLSEKNVNPESIIVGGSSRHDPFFETRKNISNDGTVLLATSGVSNAYTFAGNDIRGFNNLLESIKKVILVTREFPHKKPIIKLHPAKSYFDIISYIKEIDDSIPIYKDQNVLRFIKSCDVVISTDYSTILLEGMILNKPTMCISMQDQKHDEEPMIAKGATYFVSNINEMEEGIRKILSDNQFRDDLVKKGQKFVDECFVNQGFASKYISKKLKNY